MLLEGLLAVFKYSIFDVRPLNPPFGVIFTSEFVFTFGTPGNTHVLTNFPSK